MLLHGRSARIVGTASWFEPRGYGVLPGYAFILLLPFPLLIAVSVVAAGVSFCGEGPHRFYTVPPSDALALMSLLLLLLLLGEARIIYPSEILQRGRGRTVSTPPRLRARSICRRIALRTLAR